MDATGIFTGDPNLPGLFSTGTGRCWDTGNREVKLVEYVPVKLRASNLPQPAA